jgi:hypothetical protein
MATLRGSETGNVVEQTEPTARRDAEKRRGTQRRQKRDGKKMDGKKIRKTEGENSLLRQEFADAVKFKKLRDRPFHFAACFS